MEYVRLFVSSIVSFMINYSGKQSPFAYERVLVIRLDHLGDAVLSRAALRSLRKGLPQARILLLAVLVGPYVFLGVVTIGAICRLAERH